ncbi:MAG: outer membrane lipoprotein-sorting protein [Candidatus Eisenbacteria sp.]|nr:outer membrane lipoprotein-sorting protein [Candidatus Eisenbacteria bacterium]
MKRTGVIAVLILSLVAGSVPAEEPSGLELAEEPSALELVESVYNRPDGEDMQSRLTMTLINSRGDKRVREIRQFMKDFGDVEKKVMFFEFPADVRNTSFMNWSYMTIGEDDDQWIYLPALKKVKRISSDSKGDYFMGSDFTYDDLGDRHPSSDTHTVLGYENVNGEPCYVVQSVPIEEEYIYGRTVSWIVADKWVVVKKDFYDEDDELLKTLTVDEYGDVDGYWVVTRSTMYHIQRDHTTTMVLDDVQLDTGIPDGRFTERMMTRGL